MARGSRDRRAVAIAVACCLVVAAGCAGVEPQQPGASATVTLEPRSGSQVAGHLVFTQFGDVVRIAGEITGHAPGPRGMHIHERGDCSSPDAASAGEHFNPRRQKHGGPYDAVKHAGDLGNVVFDARGVAKVAFSVAGISVSREKADGIVGRAVVVHAQRDDLDTDPAGDSGARVACGVIMAPATPGY